MRHTRQEIAECAYTHLSKLWRGPGQRSQCRVKHLSKGIRTYRRACGNGRARLVKRFWTDCLYSSLRKGDEQADWMKEEPSSMYGGECQRNSPRAHRISFLTSSCSSVDNASSNAFFACSPPIFPRAHAACPLINGS